MKRLTLSIFLYTAICAFPCVIAAVLIALGDMGVFVKLALLLLDAAGLSILIIGSSRYYRAALHTEETLKKIKADNEGIFDDEKLEKMALLGRVDHVLTCLTDYMRVEYEATLLSRQAELYALQSQINPHFLYNTLDSIRGQAMAEGSDEMADTIEALSNLFRYNISKKDNIISVQHELDNLTCYIKIQKYRYMDRIDMAVNVRDYNFSVLNAKIPKLSLQPIVENAIHHGLDPKLGKGLITVNIAAEDGKCRLAIIDDGVGMDDETLLEIKKNLADKHYEISRKNSSHGIALYNVNERIRQCFGEDYGLNIFSIKGMGTRVEITLPYRESAS